MSSYAKAMIRASNYYLWRPLPDDFQSMEAEAYARYLENHADSCRQHWLAEQLHEYINELAEDFIDVANDGL